MELIQRMRVVTVAREYGGGGGEIARRLADRLGWRLVDHDVIAHVAQELNISEAEAASHDERVDDALGQFFQNFRFFDTVAPGANQPIPLLGNEQAYAHALSHIVTAAARTGHVVIIGRGAQMLLPDRDVLHARVVAPLAARVRYVMQREGLDAVAAQARIQAKDSERRRYIQMVYQRDTTDAQYYDVVINTGVIDLDGAADVILLALARKARRLDVPDRELGPGLGLGRYPATPEDLPTAQQAR
jgi:cytidylate kinase